MPFVTSARLLVLAAALASPVAAFAQFTLPIDPERIDGEGFFYTDNDNGANDTLTVDVDGREFGFEGQVQGNSGNDVVTIRYETDFPNSASASNNGADIQQDRQVRVTLELVPGLGSATPAYFGQAAPSKCKAQAKIQGSRSQASLSCDLRNDWQELDDDDNPATAGDPPAAVLDAVEAAFDARKDVDADVSNGRLSVKHKGEADL